MYLSILKKDLKRRKTMNLILFIFVILAVMFSASSVNDLTSVTNALDGYFEKAEVPDYWLAVPDSENQTLLDEFISEREYDFKTSAMIQVDPNEILINGEAFDYSNTLAISTLKNSTKIFRADDTEITEIEDGEIYISTLLYYDESYHMTEGDTVEISCNGKTKQFTLKEGVKDAVFGSPMMGCARFLISENDFDFFQTEDVSPLYCTLVYTDDTDFLNALNQTDIFIVTSFDYATIKLTYLMDTLMAAVILVVSGCLILISLLLLRFTIGFTINEEFREIGIMKAIGVPDRRIRGIYIVKYFAVSLVGAAIGAALSVPFGKMLLMDVSRNIVIENPQGAILNIFCAVGSCVMIVMFCYFFTRRIKRFSPIDAIRSGENGERFTRKGVLHLSRTRLSPVPFMAINDIFSDFKRFAVMIVIFSLGLLLITIPQNTINTLKSDKLISLCSMAQCDHVLSMETLFTGGDEENRAMLEERLNDVKTYLHENGAEADVFEEVLFRMNIAHGDLRTSSLAFQGIGDVTADDYTYETGSAPRNENEVAVTNMIAERIGVQIGDDVQINIGGEVRTYTVCGLFQSMNNLGEGIRFYQDAQLDYSYLVGSFGIQIRYTDSPDSSTLSARYETLEKQYPDWDVYTAGGYMNMMTGNVSGQMQGLDIMIIAVVLCINILMTTLMVKSFITKEKSQIAILKAVGFKNGSLVAWQTLRIGIALLIATALASALLLPLTHLTIEPIFRMLGATSIEFDIKPTEVFIIYPLIIFSAAAISGMLTALQLRKISASETSNIE